MGMSNEIPDRSNQTGALNLKPTTRDLIQKTPGVLGGEACVSNRRLAVWMLVRAKQVGLTDAQIRSEYPPPLTDAELAAAWKYYAEHREEIEQAIRRNVEIRHP
jgi:uncharacterized protein (DUF433 family)